MIQGHHKVRDVLLKEWNVIVSMENTAESGAPSNEGRPGIGDVQVAKVRWLVRTVRTVMQM